MVQLEQRPHRAHPRAKAVGEGVKKSTVKLPDLTATGLLEAPLLEIAKEWAKAKGLLAPFLKAHRGHLLTSSYEVACWRGLEAVGMKAEAGCLRGILRDGRGRWTLPDMEDILTDVNTQVAKVHRKAKFPPVTVYVGKTAIAAPKQRVIAKPARAATKPGKAPQARAAKRTAPKRRPTRG
jgi:hypothetical protein